MELIDVSRTISPEAAVFPGDPRVEFDWYVKRSEGADWNELMIHGFTGHRMTHIDAPYAHTDDGARINSFPVDRFVTDALVVAIEGNVITAEHIEKLPDVKGKAVLFKTVGSEISETMPFVANHPYVDKSGADALIARGVSIAGIDYLSIDADGSLEVHETLLPNNVLILEGLQLTNVEPGEYTLIALPLKIKDGDASCVRAVLMRP